MLVVLRRFNPEAMFLYKVLVYPFVDKIKLSAAFGKAGITTMRVKVLGALPFHGIVD